MFHSHEIKGDFRPIQDWVILAPEKPKAAKKGEIVRPDIAAREYGPCRVVAVGPGFRAYRDGVYGPLFPSELKPGMRVWIQRFVEGELKFRLNGEEVYAIRERHLNLVVDEPLPAS